MTSLLILRHGQSEWNLAGRWQGQADPPLTELGRRQAAVAAQALAAAQSDGGAAEHGALQRVVSSDLQRAQHTAEILATGLGIDDLVVDPTLRERNAGEWEGLTRPEIEQGWPGAIAARRWPSGFESETSVAERLLPALRRLCDSVEAVLAVGHAGVVKTVDHKLGLADEPIPNLAGRWYHIDAASHDWDWPDVSPAERVEFVPSDIDLAIE